MPKFEREIEINAPVERVWEVLVDPNYWKEWFIGIDSVSNVTSVSEGESFDWTREGGTGQGTFVKVQPMKYLEITTQSGEDKDAHTFALQPIGKFLGLGGDKCKLEYKVDTLMGGGLLGRFVAGGNPKDMMQVKKTTQQLKKLVESR